MGILGLSKLLHDKCPGAIKEGEIKNYFGRRIAIDASMSIYQFIIAMKSYENGQNVELRNANGEVTSHLNGLFQRTIKMIEEGLRPIYVFDGAPPELKREVTLKERSERAAAARAELERLQQAGPDGVPTGEEATADELMEKLSKRTVRVTREQTEECKRLLRLMGLPIVQAPSEAEAQCAELVRGGKAWAVGTEDMDALTFGAPILLRHLNYGGSNSKDARKIAEFHLDTVLAHTGMTMAQFIDLCILLGCDYSVKIPGIGPVKAWDYIAQHGSIEKILDALDKDKFKVPDEFNYVQARELFRSPETTPADQIELEWGEPDLEGLKQFLCEEKLFNPERVERGVARLRAAMGQKTQGRLDNFFGFAQKPAAPAVTAMAGHKRAAAAAKDLPAGKLRRVDGNKKAVKK